MTPLIHATAVAVHAAIRRLAEESGEPGVPEWVALQADHKRAMYAIARAVLRAQDRWYRGIAFGDDVADALSCADGAFADLMESPL